MTADRYRIEARPPTPEEYRRLCTAVGWEPVINFDAAEASLERSLFCCVALDGDEAVGMGRVVGDGAIYFYVQDVAVAPPQAFVGLFAAAGTEPFYRRFGFEAHAGLTGMFQTTVRRG